MSNMTYCSNLRISVFLSIQRIKRERKRDRKKKKKKKDISLPLRCAAVSESSAVSRGYVDKVILLRRRSGGKERRYREEETL